MRDHKAEAVVIADVPEGSETVRVEIMRQAGPGNRLDDSNRGDVYDMPIAELRVLRDD